MPPVPENDIYQRVNAGPRKIEFPLREYEDREQRRAGANDQRTAELPVTNRPTKHEIAVTRLDHFVPEEGGPTQLAGLQSYRPKIIVVWNNKGGVAKTTTTHSLAFALASNSHNKVLMVDCDGQQNLLQLAFRKAVYTDQHDEIAGDYLAYLSSRLPRGLRTGSSISLEAASRKFRDTNGTAELCVPHAFEVPDGPGTRNNKRLFFVAAGEEFERIDAFLTQKFQQINMGQEAA